MKKVTSRQSYQGTNYRAVITDFFSLSEEDRDKKYPSVRVYLPGESLWARKIDKDAVFLDNNPLDGSYKYLDFVKCENGQIKKLLFRTYPYSYLFRYSWGSEESKQLELNRRDIYSKLTAMVGERPEADISFFVEGLGYIHSQKPLSPEQMDGLSKIEQIIEVVLLGSPNSKKVE